MASWKEAKAVIILPMKTGKGFRYLCFVSGILFLGAPALQLAGLIQVYFPDGEWVPLKSFGTFFGGSEEIVNQGNSYIFAYRLNPFYIVLMAVSLTAALASFFGKDCRKNLIFSGIAGFLALLLASFMVLIFHGLNPGFALNGIRGGIGFALSITSYVMAFVFLAPAFLFAEK